MSSATPSFAIHTSDIAKKYISQKRVDMQNKQKIEEAQKNNQPIPKVVGKTGGHKMHQTYGILTDNL
tara:strand:+ start:327 stop:527 length:201 start_codon:yes stop_codon:yes gene_type:complete